MNICKKGDLLLSDLGGTFKYICKDESSPYPHKVQHMDGEFKGSFGTRLDDGRVVENSLPTDNNIVGFYVSKKKPLIWYEPTRLTMKNVGKILSASISHISETDCFALDNNVNVVPDCIGVVYDLKDVGFLIHARFKLNKTDLKYLTRNGLSRSLGNIIMYAQSIGCEFIILNPTHAVIPTLKTYKW